MKLFNIPAFGEMEIDGSPAFRVDRVRASTAETYAAAIDLPPSVADRLFAADERQSLI